MTGSEYISYILDLQDGFSWKLYRLQT